MGFSSQPFWASPKTISELDSCPDSTNLSPLPQPPKSPSQLQKKPKLSWPIHLLLSLKPPQLLPPPKLKLKKRKKNPKKSPTLIWDLTCLVKNLIKKPKCNIIPSYVQFLTTNQCNNFSLFVRIY